MTGAGEMGVGDEVGLGDGGGRRGCRWLRQVETVTLLPDQSILSSHVSLPRPEQPGCEAKPKAEDSVTASLVSVQEGPGAAGPADAGLGGPQGQASLLAQNVKNLSAMQETQVPSLGWEDPLEIGNGNPLQYSCLENPLDRGTWWAIVLLPSPRWRPHFLHLQGAIPMRRK